ncbi:MAG: Xaa-Pro dipeptidase [Rhodospirillaceae bacterium]|nr:Xaa-Pro dipeptidase [Rhodospirillaceae bacterium]
MACIIHEFLFAEYINVTIIFHSYTQKITLDKLKTLYSKHLDKWSRRFTEACEINKLDGIIVFSGSQNTRFRDDNKYPFYSEPYFNALIPQVFPNSAIKIMPGDKPVLVHTESTDFWHKSPETPSGFWTNYFKILTVSDEKEMLEVLEISSDKLAAIGENAPLLAEFSTINDQALFDYLDFHRAYKTEYEIACITEANKIAATGHAVVQKKLTLKTNKYSEFELNQIYCNETQQRESELPYQNIVALNEHASTLHYQNLNKKAPETFHSFLLDAGATFNGYASDITRTISEKKSNFENLIKSINELQQNICAEAKSGVSFIFLNELTHVLLAGVLKENNLIKAEAEEIIYERGITKFFLPHGLGHLLGLQVHDKGGYLSTPDGKHIKPSKDHPFLRLTRHLEPNFVLTIEPGIYFIPSLLEKLKSSSSSNLINWTEVEKMMVYGGVRIEDNILVTHGEHLNLTRSAFKKVALS